MDKQIKLTESEAIKIAKSIITDGFTMALMNLNESEDFIWGYLYEQNLQYKKPIFYTDDLGNESAIVIYEKI